MPDPHTDGIAGLAAAIAAPAPSPAAGAAIGAVAALAAALVEKASALTPGALEAEQASARSVRAVALAFREIDELAFAEISVARRAGGDVPAAWVEAARVPLDLAETCAALAELARSALPHANARLRGELECADELARAAGLAAARLAEIDLDEAGPAAGGDRHRIAAVRTALTA
jgi:formiminotetrahydrofolate cyclodeaminase